MATRSDNIPPRDQGTFRVDRRSLLAGAGLAAGGALHLLRNPTPMNEAITQEDFSASIPDTVAKWKSRKSQEIVLPPQDGSDDIYDHIETRMYEGEGLTPIMLLIAFSQKQQNDIHVHRPEVCYPAAGFPIISNRQTEFNAAQKTLTGRELLADRGSVRERIVYWVRVGNAFPTSWPQQRMTMAIQNLRGAIPDGTLFRVSAIEGATETNTKTIFEFIDQFISAVPQAFREKVLL